jgi:uncharacterized peroxidase-related enzyme
MAFIDAVHETDAAADVAKLYAEDRERLGYVANYTKTFSSRPRVLRAWQQLNAAIKAGMEPRRYELATVAAARRLRSSYCTLAHGKLLAEQFLSPEQATAIVGDHRDAGLDPVEVAVMDLAEKVATSATSITAADLGLLHEHGFTDPEILDVILAAAARCFFSTVLDATGTLPDSAFGSLDPDLRHALTVGRPISDA